ncbi:unnamed protein product [Trichobilharzia szidati]|nr:unnamed protein product [Trichobilharzia szidati]
MTNNIDVVTAIHCNRSENKLSRSNSDASCKAKRRVRFPEDDALISDYLEPFRLVPDNCSSEELLAAYLSSCYEYKVAPIEFLLEQLKGIDLSICNERYSRLSLRGIRLNRFHIETMEEIFRRVHFREIDLEHTFLDEQSASSLFDMLLHYESCTDLGISLNLDRSGASQAWSRCVTYIRKSFALRHFTLSHTPLDIGNFLGLSFYGLCVERLSFIDCNLSGQGLFGLAQWLRVLLSSSSLHPPVRDRSTSSGGMHKFRGWKHRMHSHSVFFPNKITTTTTSNTATTTTTTTTNNSTGATSDTASSTTAKTKITAGDVHKPSVWELKLCLTNNKLIASDAETLVPLIRHQLLVPVMPQTKPNIISNNTNHDDSSDKLFNDSCTKFPKLQKSNSISSPSSLSSSSLMVCNNLPVGGIGYLHELDLSHNNIGDDGLVILCTGLLQAYRNRLRDRSSTPNNQDSIEKAVSCSSSLSESLNESELQDTKTESADTNIPPMKVRGLERLSLVNNNLGVHGMQSLALVLMQTPESLVSLVGGLVSLDLSCNMNIGDKGVEILSEGLIRNHSLKELYLRSIRMSFPGIFALSSFLTESKCLKHLDIRNNELDLASLMALSKTLYINRTLTSLFTDARRLLSSELYIADKDKELFDSLVKNIEANLRRNRLESEPPNKDSNNNNNNDTSNDHNISSSSNNSSSGKDVAYTNCSTTTSINNNNDNDNPIADVVNQSVSSEQSDSFITNISSPIDNDDNNNISNNNDHQSIMSNHDVLPVEKTEYSEEMIIATDNCTPVHENDISNSNNNISGDACKVNGGNEGAEEMNDHLKYTINSIDGDDDPLNELTDHSMDSKPLPTTTESSTAQIMDITNMNDRILKLSVDELTEDGDEDDKLITIPLSNDTSNSIIPNILTNNQHELLNNSNDADLFNVQSAGNLFPVDTVKQNYNNINNSIDQSVHINNDNSNEGIHHKNVNKQKLKKNKRMNNNNSNKHNSSSSSSSTTLKNHSKVNSTERS